MPKYTSGRQKELKVGISSYSEGLTSLEVIGNVSVSGVVSATSFSGENLSSEYSPISGVSTSVIGGIASVSQLNVIGISTFFNGPVLIGSSVPTGTQMQQLQVTGGVYISGQVGVGTTSSVAKLHVVGDANIDGLLTVFELDSLSDERLKTNIKKFDNVLDKVDSINGVTFDWKLTGKSSAGIIAQDVEKVFPELINDTDVKRVNYNGLIGVLIECVKELREEVEYLKSKIKD